MFVSVYGCRSMKMKRFTQVGNNVFFREGAPLLGLYWLYSTIRWLIARNSPYIAFQNAITIIELEIRLGIFHELTIQRWLIDHAMKAVQIANEFYTIGYIPVLILFSVLLYRFEPERFFIFKLAFLLSLGFALVCFSVFPLAPPRFLPEFGFVDTQEVFGSSLYNRKSVLSFYNPYAAMPSLHFGSALLGRHNGLRSWTSYTQILRRAVPKLHGSRRRDDGSSLLSGHRWG